MSVLTKDLACREAVELVTDYLEGALSRRERRAFERHLGGLRRLRRRTSTRSAPCSRRRAGSVPRTSTPTTLDGLVRLFREHRDDA